MSIRIHYGKSHQTHAGQLLYRSTQYGDDRGIFHILLKQSDSNRIRKLWAQRYAGQIRWERLLEECRRVHKEWNT